MKSESDDSDELTSTLFDLFFLSLFEAIDLRECLGGVASPLLLTGDLERDRLSLRRP